MMFMSPVRSEENEDENEKTVVFPRTIGSSCVLKIEGGDPQEKMETSMPLWSHPKKQLVIKVMKQTA